MTARRPVSEKLLSKELKPEDVHYLDQQVADFVQRVAGGFSVHTVPLVLFRELARDCYFQGLLDGGTISRELIRGGKVIGPERVERAWWDAHHHYWFVWLPMQQKSAQE